MWSTAAVRRARSALDYATRCKQLDKTKICKVRRAVRVCGRLGSCHTGNRALSDKFDGRDTLGVGGCLSEGSCGKHGDRSLEDQLVD